MSEASGSPIRRDGGVGNHDGLKVESTVCNKHNGLRLLLQHWCCAPQHLPCTQFEDEQLSLQMLTQNLMRFTKIERCNIHQYLPESGSFYVRHPN